MKMQKNNKNRVLDILFGGFIGLLNGFFGSGGGIIAVPILEKLKKMETKVAHSTSIAVIFPLSLISGVLYFCEFDLKIETLIFLAVGATVGGVVGSICLKKFASKIVRVIFAILMLVAGVKMFF